LLTFQTFTNTCGQIGLASARDAFLATLCRFAVPEQARAHDAAVSISGQPKKTCGGIFSKIIMYCIFHPHIFHPHITSDFESSIRNVSTMQEARRVH
jgi:hypothetical protein